MSRLILEIYLCCIGVIIVSNFCGSEGAGAGILAGVQLVDRKQSSVEGTLNTTDHMTPRKDCSKSETNGEMVSVNVSPCDGKKRCPLIKGTNVTLTIEFIPDYPAKEVQGALYGVLFGGWVTVPFGSAESLCGVPERSCPLQKGKLYHYEKTIYVSSAYPSAEVDVKVRVTGDQKGDIACVLIPVKIQAAD